MYVNGTSDVGLEQSCDASIRSFLLYSYGIVLQLFRHKGAESLRQMVTMLATLPTLCGSSTRRGRRSRV